MGSDPEIARKRFNNGCDDNFPNHVSHPIPTQDLSLSSPPTKHANSLRLHFWYCLVGSSPQLDRLFCRLSCNILSKIYSLI